jgi:hypothetical protein
LVHAEADGGENDTANPLGNIAACLALHIFLLNASLDSENAVPSCGTTADAP